jgi:hypothetical protein
MRIILVLALLAASLFALDEPHKYYGRWSRGLPADSAFFPIAVWLQSPSNAQAYKNAGINLFVGLWAGPTAAQLDQLYSAGMKTICDQNSIGLSASRPSVIAGWMHGDEPDNAQWNDVTQTYDPCIDTSIIKADYATWRVADSTRPIYLNLGQGVSYINWVGRGACSGNTRLYPGYIRGCDIVSYDIYPVNSTYSAVQGNLWYVPKGIDSLEMWGNNSKPAWCWIETTQIDSPGQAPTPSQVRSEVWMALIHGANGIGYFCHSWYPSFIEAGWLNNTTMRNAITALNLQVQGLAAVLNGPDRSSFLAVQTSRPAVPVDAVLKIQGGSTYIFAAAMRNDTATGTFTISGISGTQTVQVLDEGRNLTLSGGVFRDAFTGYGIHLYKINAVPAAVETAPLVPVLRPGVNTITTVYNIKGQMVRRQKGTADLDRGLGSGVYVLRIASNGTSVFRKRVVMR